MKSIYRWLSAAALALGMFGVNHAKAQDLPYRVEKATPLADVVRPQLKPYTDLTNLKAARIAWGADLITVAGEKLGFYTAEGLNVSFYTDDDLKHQVQEMLDGKLHFLRMTMGQAVQAAPAFEKAGTDLVFIVQISWSVGGDTITSVAEIKTVSDLRGKRVVMMIYGPHPEYFAKMLVDAQVDPASVEIVWVEKILKSDKDKNGKFVDPFQAFQSALNLPKGKRIDAAMLISPEAAEATGKEGIPGVHVLHTTKDSPYITADGYAVRGDFFDAHRDVCERFTRATLKSAEWIKDADRNSAAFKEVMKLGASALLSSDDPMAAEGMLGDCSIELHGGNHVFFTGRNADGTFDFRNGKTLITEIVTSFGKMGIITPRSADKFPVRLANWDFAALGKGLKYVDVVQRTVFDTNKTEQFVQNLIGGEAGSLDQLASLVTRNITFKANEKDFDPMAYTDMYQQLWELGSTHAGTPIAVIGFADPSAVMYLQQAKKIDEPRAKQLMGTLRATSHERAKQVVAAFFAWCEKERKHVEKSQYVATGVGGDQPRTDMKPIVALIAEAVAAKDDAKFQRAVELASPNRIVEFRLQRTQGAELGNLQDLTDLMNKGGK